jgi:hypothetical protein
MGTKLKYSVEYEVFDSTITDMLDAAGYGMTSWAVEMNFKARGDALYIEVIDGEGEVHEATYVKLREAFGKLVDPEQDYIGKWVHEYFIDSVKDRDEKTGEIDAGHIDSTAADCWVQVALFDEVVYS